MTYLPFAVVSPRPVNSSQDPWQTHTQCIFHTAVSGLEGDGPPFPSGANAGVDWTGYIPSNGEVHQFRDLEVNADAQDDANPYATSWESWDNGDPEGTPWTPAQIAAIKAIIVVHNTVLGIPYQQCPAWNAPGFGYHRLFTEWDHPEHYHSCPGNLRVEQWNNEILPFLAHMAAGGAYPEDDFVLDTTTLQQIHDAAASASKEVVLDIMRKEVEPMLSGLIAAVITEVHKVSPSTSSSSPVDAAAIAKAIVDDIHNRLES